MKRSSARKRSVRPQRTQRSSPSRPSAIAVVRAELQMCTQQVDDLRRAVTGLRAEVDHLREKIRG